jgi:uncharacterized protein
VNAAVAKTGSTPATSVTTRGGEEAARARRSFWLKQLHQWHWVSSAVCLVGMLCFAITGVTLNHAGEIEAAPRTTTATATLPDALVSTLAPAPASEAAPRSGSGRVAPDAVVPDAVVAFIAETMAVDLSGRAAEWSDDEIYVALPRPGGDAFLTIERASGAIEYELTDRGWISYLNDLHKGRNTGGTWKWFLDVFAAGCVVFCVTGLFLLQMHARRRPATWPVVGLGLVVPVVIALLLIH